jgi:hypothetical protein
MITKVLRILAHSLRLSTNPVRSQLPPEWGLPAGLQSPTSSKAYTIASGLESNSRDLLLPQPALLFRYATGSLLQAVA